MSGYVDSASIAGVLMLITEESVQQISVWTRQSAVETTTVLIFNDQMGIAPGTDPYQSSEGLHTKVSSALQEIAFPTQPTDASRRLSAIPVEEWCSVPETRDAWLLTKRDDSYAGDSCANWRDVSRTRFWVEHASKLRCLFNESHIPVIAAVLTGSDDPQDTAEIRRDLTRLHAQSQDVDQVRKWAGSHIRTAEIQLVEDAFAIAAIIRGPFHEYVAAAESRQILHHPIRRALLPDLEIQQVAYATEVERYFTLLALISALAGSSKHVDARIQRWAANVRQARTALRTGALVFPEEASVTDPAASAFDLARKTGFEFPAPLAARLVDKALEWLLEPALTGLALLMFQQQRFLRASLSQRSSPALGSQFGAGPKRSRSNLAGKS